jgi:hypothetical protein
MASHVGRIWCCPLDCNHIRPTWLAMLAFVPLLEGFFGFGLHVNPEDASAGTLHINEPSTCT